METMYNRATTSLTNGDFWVSLIMTILIFFVEELLRKALNPDYPKDEEFVYIEKRINILEDLYYKVCINSKSGKEIDTLTAKTILSGILWTIYFQNVAQRKLFSARLQSLFWKFRTSPSEDIVRKIQNQTAKEYAKLCKRLEYGIAPVTGQKSKRLTGEAIFYASAALCILSSILSIIMDFSATIEASLILLSMFLGGIASWYYYHFVKKN